MGVDFKAIHRQVAGHIDDGADRLLGIETM